MADRSMAARLRRALSGFRSGTARLATDRRGVSMVWFALLLPLMEWIIATAPPEPEAAPAR